jgi:hypothetical protein
MGLWLRYVSLRVSGSTDGDLPMNLYVNGQDTDFHIKDGDLPIKLIKHKARPTGDGYSTALIVCYKCGDMGLSENRVITCNYL